MDLIKRYEALKVKAQDVDTSLRINQERASDLKSEIKSSLVDMGFKNRKELQAKITSLQSDIESLVENAEKTLSGSTNSNSDFKDDGNE